jgi:quercetin dioxygenase-like cupin family protein
VAAERPVVVQQGLLLPRPGGSAAVTTLGPGRGCPNLVQRLVAIGPGGDWRTRTGGGGECWYVEAGTATVEAGSPHRVDAGTGLFLPPKRRCRVVNEGAGTVRIVAVVLPEPSAGTEALVAALDECPVERTGEREFRVLLGALRGFAAATQFVGAIPRGRAPEHAHPYDEVVRVLEGDGCVHAGGKVHPLRAGTCLYLPPNVPHCLENTSDAAMVVLGVFHPGGSPATKLPPPRSATHAIHARGGRPHRAVAG